MEIRQVLLKNFKRFSEIEFSFSAGLNLVKGPNEAGKSTLHEAIIVALLERPTGKQSERGNQSWDQERLYELKLTYALPSGEQYTIDKNFEASTHEILGPGGRDSSRLGLNSAVESALGTTSEKLFSSTACIRQDSMLELDKGGKEVSSQLQEIALGGVSGVNTTLDRLEDKIMEFQRGWKTHAPRNPGPIGQLKKQIKELDELIQSIGLEIEQREKALEELYQQRARVAAIEGEYDPLQKLQLSNTERKDLMQALSHHSQLEQELEAKMERVEAAERRKSQVRKRLDGLEPFNTVDEAKEKAFRVAREAWSARSAEVEDRKQRVFELIRQVEDGKKIKIRKGLFWIVGMILVGLTMVCFNALSGQILESMYRTALMIAGGILTSAGVVWLLVLILGQFRDYRHHQQLLVEAQKRHQGGMAQLNMATNEMKELLGSLGCKTWEEFESNLAKFRKLKADLNMVEATLAALLSNGGSLSALEDHRREVSRVRRDIQEKLTEFEGIPRLSAIEYQKLIGNIESLDKERQQRQEQIIRLGAILESGGASLDEFYRYMERRAVLQRRLELALEKHQVFQETLEGLREVRDGILKNAQAKLEPRLGHYLIRLTQGRYNQAFVDEDLQISISLNSKSERRVRMEDLSSGTRDQVYFAARVALCDLIFQEARPPLLMDDPFIKFDPDRKEAALQVCKEISADRQIILFTCHDGYDAFADHVILLGENRTFISEDGW